MSKMRAAILYGPYDVRIEKVDVPEPNVDEVVIKVKATGICPTDLRKYTGDVLVKRPIILGHEFSGVISKVGDHVSDVKEGEHVIANPFLYCHKCYYCREGRFKHCINLGAVGGAAEFGERYGGSFAEYLRVPSRNVYRIPVGVSWEEAALVEPLAACLNGLSLCDPKPGDTIAIIGAGPIGLLHLQLSRFMGAGWIIVSELLEHRRRKAEELGADFVIDPSRRDPVKAVRELTDGRGADIVIVATGRSEEATCTEQGLRMAARGGVVNIFAGTWPETLMRVDPNIIHYREIKLIGSYLYNPETFLKAAKIVFSGRLKLREIISHIFPLSEIKKGFEVARDRRGLKVMINPEVDQ